MNGGPTWLASLAATTKQKRLDGTDATESRVSVTPAATPMEKRLRPQPEAQNDRASGGSRRRAYRIRDL